MRSFKVGDRVKTKKVPTILGKEISEKHPFDTGLSEKFGTVVNIVSKIPVVKLEPLLLTKSFDSHELLHVCSCCNLETCPSIDNGD